MGRTGFGALLATSIGLVVVGCDGPKPPATQPAATKPTTTTAPATTRAVEPLVELLDVLRRDDPDYPTTRPLAETLDVTAAARVWLKEPTYLCSRGDLWITRADAPPTPEALKLAPKKQTHVTRESIRYVYWRPGTTPWTPELVVDDAGPSTQPATAPATAQRTVWIAGDRRLPLDPSIDRDWSRARDWTTEKIKAVIVPTSTGVSVIRVEDGKLDERHVKLLDAPAGRGVSTQFALDVRGLLAWSAGGDEDARVARFVDGDWKLLTPSPDWPAALVHVLPFQDGSVLTIADTGNTLSLHSTPVETVGVDEGHVRELVAKLADPLPEVREAAQAELAAIGPAAWPLLAKLADTQKAEARIRIRAILGDQTTPTLGGVTPEPGTSRLVARLGDGGVILYFAGGASAVDPYGVVRTAVPAWLAVRPSGPVRALPPLLVGKLDPRHASIKAWGDEWIVEHDVDGPLRWMGNHFEPCTRGQAERQAFKRFVGIDSMGRWVLQSPEPGGPTLVVDVTLPDPRPRLPTWAIDVGASGAAGWTDDDWPATKRGGAWALKESNWSVIEGDVDQKLHTAATQPATMPATTQATTQITTQASSQPTTQATPSLLTDAAGNVYEDGLAELVVHRKDGSTLRWPLPPEASGTGVLNGEAVLMEAEDRLFLCNAAGRVLRLKRQFDRPDAPFKLEATFSRGIPATDIRRIWKDPAGRLCFASEGHKLAIAFPNGRIEGEMTNIIPANAIREALRGEDEPATDRR